MQCSALILPAEYNEAIDFKEIFGYKVLRYILQQIKESLYVRAIGEDNVVFCATNDFFKDAKDIIYSMADIKQIDILKADEIWEKLERVTPYVHGRDIWLVNLPIYEK